ncbi:WXG100 family type VII secretion target [Nocardia alni]|uniref:WXG100 family type VII secretion target n=1 Tax=Nocardia alni TaxID=2815723 RepID=UPI001C21BE9D|nr:WXG100 family type VII secretion target [Nocardia alni]
MAATYRVDLDEMQRLIDATTTLESAIEQSAADIDKRVETLHVDWNGDAATAHKTAHDTRIAAVTEMREALTELRRTLTTAREAYDAVGPTNHGMWPQ